MSRASLCRNRFRSLCSFALLAPAIAIAASAATATTLAHMSVAQMSQTAPVIVRARCIENSTRWDAGEIWTFTRFAVEDVWKRSAPAQITVRLLGGTTGNLTSTVDGIPRFRPGQTAILFLEPTSHGDLSVLSWQQGTFRVRRNTRSTQENVTQDTASFATFDAASHRFEIGGIRDLPLDALRQQVRAALSSGAAQRQP
jgi:hypothetical protein